MANDRETKSYEVKSETRPDQADAIRASNERGERLTRGGAGGTMSGGRDADLRAHGESGSSGVGLPPAPDNDMRINTRDGARATGSESGGGSGAVGASTGTNPDQDIGTGNE
jgi:hypothetical protein